MEERGFDVLQTGSWPLILVASTIILVLIILAGGLYMRNKEMEWRAANKEEEADRAEAARKRHLPQA